MLDCAKLNRIHNSLSLAMPETCLLHMAKVFLVYYQCNKMPLTTLQGILPSLQAGWEVEDIDLEDSTVEVSVETPLEYHETCLHPTPT